MAILTVVVSITATLLASEVKAWLPWMTKRLVTLSIRILPEDERERYGEEWPSYLSEIPGDIGKALAASGFVFAGIGIRIEQHGLRGAATIEALPVSEEVSQNQNRLTLGLLPEPEGGTASFIVSIILNVCVFGFSFLLGYIAKPPIH
jgi:hypothetical protein